MITSFFFHTVICLLYSRIAQSNSFYFKKELQTDFQNTFHDRCDKYAFVHKWVHMLDNPPEKVRTIYF